jgi:hypothetical protein
VTSTERTSESDQKRLADAARAAQARRLRWRRKRGRRNETESGHHEAELRAGARR